MAAYNLRNPNGCNHFTCKSKISPQGDQSLIIVMLFLLFHLDSTKSVGDQFYLVKLSTYTVRKLALRFVEMGVTFSFPNSCVPIGIVSVIRDSWRDRCNRWTFILGSKIKKLALDTKAISWNGLQGAPGFEPGTIRSAVGCSTTELRPQIIPSKLKKLMKLIAN